MTVDKWDGCAWRDSTVTAGTTYDYFVTAVVGGIELPATQHAQIRVSGSGGPVFTANGTTRAAIQAAGDAANAAGGGVVQLAGTPSAPVTYALDGMVDGTAWSNVVIRGGGKTATIIQPAPSWIGNPGSGGVSPTLIRFGRTVNTAGSLAAAINPGDRTTQWTSVAGLAVGDVIKFNQRQPQTGDPNTFLARCRSLGIVHDPTGMDDRFPCETNEIVAISGTSVTFRYPFACHFTTSVVPQRIVCSRVGVERCTVQGKSSTNMEFFWGVDLGDSAFSHVADVLVRWTNAKFIATKGYRNRIVDVDGPDGGAAGYGSAGTDGNTVKYRVLAEEGANLTMVGCVWGTSGDTHQQSWMTGEFMQRVVVRHSQFFDTLSHAVNEHGTGSRYWLVENCYFHPGPNGRAVWHGNGSWGFSGETITRNCLVDGGFDALYYPENPRSTIVLDCTLRNFSNTALWINGWAGSGIGGIQNPANYGSIKLVFRRNTVSTTLDTGYGVVSDQGVPTTGYQYLGVKDIVINGNSFAQAGQFRSAVWLRGDSTQTNRFQIFDNSRTYLGSPAWRATLPALVPGDYLNNNGDGVTYGSRSVQPWEVESFAWEGYDTVMSSNGMPVTLTDAPVITTDASLSNHFRVTLGGNRLLANPTNATDGQKVIWEIIQDATGNRSLSLDSAFTFGTTIPSFTTTATPNRRDFLGAVYNATTARWYVLAVAKGY
ncbi:hypothetical protein [Gandjariella thermophila]|nr:hypothetical protein [Gandjariella thermophila]